MKDIDMAAAIAPVVDAFERIGVMCSHLPRKINTSPIQHTHWMPVVATPLTNQA